MMGECCCCRDTSSTLAGSLARRGPMLSLGSTQRSPARARETSSMLAGALQGPRGSGSGQQWARPLPGFAGRGGHLGSSPPHLPAVTAAQTL